MQVLSRFVQRENDVFATHFKVPPQGPCICQFFKKDKKIPISRLKGHLLNQPCGKSNKSRPSMLAIISIGSHNSNRVFLHFSKEMFVTYKLANQAGLLMLSPFKKAIFFILKQPTIYISNLSCYIVKNKYTYDKVFHLIHLNILFFLNTVDVQVYILRCHK